MIDVPDAVYQGVVNLIIAVLAWLLGKKQGKDAK